ncbi:NUDIX domain-containing protein [Ktedonospora formicarum]|uniref:Nudix hydrolase domain-containing protein n=1 Tax=Ktedonospora formicarum TaxID=2778364 RepID=A0A8J3HUM6_9CHLR|nr:NUDIX hydrolase [Ktedonospora formicarum]GHO44342.1 hypothetical protein KSX_25050 [Ktedonospora formicarum]
MAESGDRPVSGNESRPKRPLSLGAGAVVVYDNKVLLVRNLHGVTRGKYLLPSGRVKAGELPDVTAVRETFEETHLRIEIEGLLGVRLWVMDDGEHNYFFMFKAHPISPISELYPDPQEVDDARFFSRADMEALNPEETWSGALAIAYKGLDQEALVWPNHAHLSNSSGVEGDDHWRIWL